MLRGSIFFNDKEIFSGIPESVWNYVIGSLKPLQNYLKARRGRLLTTSEITNIKKMVVSLNDTIELQGRLSEIRTEF